MLIKRPEDIKASEITPPKLYMARRAFIRGAALLATTAATGFLYRRLNAPPQPRVEGTKLTGVVKPEAAEALRAGYAIDEQLTPFENITTYNNFYEFTTDKEDVADEARGFVTRPWTVSVEGLANKPKVFDLDDLVKLAPLEDRVYRMRCVEGWSMVIPWVGFPLKKLLDAVEPNSAARFVQFETLYDPKRMPGQNGGG